MDHIRHIFFDLDHTLWDFETNSGETISGLLEQFRDEIGFELHFEDFYPVYQQVNEELWKAYRESRINSAHLRRVRFRRAFDQFGIPDNLWMDLFGQAYMEQCPTRSRLMPFAQEILSYLYSHYQLHLITNGFTQTQATKIHHSGLEDFFQQVITSESAQAKKPDPAIFEYAFNIAETHPRESLYIGDNYEADVMGGIGAGMDVIFFNPERKENPLKVPEVSCLSELRPMLKK